ncbi:MAG: NADH:flavin oxidoreductase [Novosphingobium sp.]
MDSLFSPLSFQRGPPMANRFMLSPLTTCQSNADGTLSEEELRWLTMRAQGGFGLTMTCAMHVQKSGQGFAGQLGIFADRHVEGLTRLAGAIKEQGSLAIAQIYHAGMRALPEVIGEAPVCPSDNEAFGARAMTLSAVERFTDDFVMAAMRAEQAGLDGVEIHGAHGYLICEFLSPALNQRTDRYGGDFNNRARLLRDLITGIRQSCGAQFSVGVRLSAELFDLRLAEMKLLAEELMVGSQIDYLDMSLLAVFKQSKEPEHHGPTVLEHFTALKRGNTRLGAAGMMWNGENIGRAFAAGLDMVGVGRAAIMHHDFPIRMREDMAFNPVKLPVSPHYLAAEGVSPAFMQYLVEGFPGIVARSAAEAEGAMADADSLVAAAT